jgi:hypothetical protein
MERVARERAEREAAGNRVLVGLPERLEKAKAALKEFEGTLEDIRTLYSQRVTLKDSVVLDQIGELLGVPHIEGKPEVIEVDRGRNCPACTGRGNGPFCTAHDWHNQS